MYLSLMSNYLTLNPFVPNAPLLYPLRTSEKPYGFLVFSGGRKKVHWEQMGQQQRQNVIVSPNSSVFVNETVALTSRP